jgi:hypothetical protein
MQPEYPSVAEHARAIAPDAKIVYIVRNPVHRAISHYKHLLAWDLAPAPDYDTAFRIDSRFVDFGRYWWQLEPWLEAFDDAVKVVVFEDYTKARQAVVDDTFDFLGLDRGARIDVDGVLNQSSEARAVTGWWQSFLMSQLYQDQLRPRVPVAARTWLRDTVLPRARKPQAGPSTAAVERIIDGCHEDAERLRSFLGRKDELWDWEQARGRSE